MYDHGSTLPKGTTARSPTKPRIPRFREVLVGTIIGLLPTSQCRICSSMSDTELGDLLNFSFLPFLSHDWALKCRAWSSLRGPSTKCVEKLQIFAGNVYPLYYFVPVTMCGTHFNEIRKLLQQDISSSSENCHICFELELYRWRRTTNTTGLSFLSVQRQFKIVLVGTWQPIIFSGV